MPLFGLCLNPSVLFFSRAHQANFGVSLETETMGFILCFSPNVDPPLEDEPATLPSPFNFKWPGDLSLFPTLVCATLSSNTKRVFREQLMAGCISSSPTYPPPRKWHGFRV